MIKKLLKLNKRESLKYDLVARPLIIYCILVSLIAIIGAASNTLSIEIIGGGMGSMLVNFLVTYGNLVYVEAQEIGGKM